MAFDNEFALTGENAPLGDSPANNIDGYILDSTKKSLNERYSLEHRSLTDGVKEQGDPNAEGRHIPGLVGCVFVGTLLQRDALSGMGVGAICYVTDEQNFYHYTATGWQILAINSDTIFADEESLTYDVNTLKMKRDNQQWTETFTLTDGANISTDCTNSNSFGVIIGGNRVLDNPTNLKEGATYVWVVTQDGTGSRTLSFGTYFKWAGGLAPLMSTGIGAVDIITAIAQNDSAVPGVYDWKLYSSILYDFS